MTGYFVFSPAEDDTFRQHPAKAQPLSPTQLDAAGSTKSTIDEAERRQEEEWARKRAVYEERRRRRLERERQLIWHSELEWVRSGGILRDADGRRDKARTEMMRAEIRLQEEERRVQEEWKAYESGWSELPTVLRTKGEISWQDIPWPVHGTPMSPEDLTPDAIANFLFAPLKIRGSTGVAKDRIRLSFLRWHPDKFPPFILAKAREDERDMIVDGVNAVFMSLKHIQDAGRRPT